MLHWRASASLGVCLLVLGCDGWFGPDIPEPVRAAEPVVLADAGAPIVAPGTDGDSTPSCSAGTEEYLFSVTHLAGTNWLVAHLRIDGEVRPVEVAHPNVPGSSAIGRRFTARLLARYRRADAPAPSEGTVVVSAYESAREGGRALGGRAFDGLHPAHAALPADGEVLGVLADDPMNPSGYTLLAAFALDAGRLRTGFADLARGTTPATVLSALHDEEARQVARSQVSDVRVLYPEGI